MQESLGPQGQQETAPSPERRDEESLLLDYLRLLAARQSREPAEVSPGHQVRSCAWCGRRSIFHIDPEGVWARCSQCGRYA